MALHEGIIDLGQNFKEVIDGEHAHRSGSFFTAPIMYLFAKQMGAKNILEIGIGAGSAGYWLGHAAKEMGGKYFGIEIHASRVKGVCAWMEKFELPHKIWTMDSRDMTFEFVKQNIGRIDLAYLDGDHSLEAIWHEILTVWPFIRTDGKGYVFIHDIFTTSKEGWAKVRDNFVETFEINAQSGMGIVKKP